VIQQTGLILFTVLVLTACSNIPAQKEETRSTPASVIKSDEVQRAEPLHRFANSPYSVLGKTYIPLISPGEYKERGIASWYGRKFHGKRTASGEIYDMYSMSAAHPVLPIPSYARVTNLANKKSVVVRINDRGPFVHDRIIDLSYTAADKLGIVNNGGAEVVVEMDRTRMRYTSPVQDSSLNKKTY